MVDNFSLAIPRVSTFRDISEYVTRSPQQMPGRQNGDGKNWIPVAA